MTHPTSVVALFCEDIRDERSGQVSLIGVMLDNAAVSTTGAFENASGIIPKICVYMRASFDVDAAIDSITFVLDMPDGERLTLGVAGTPTVEEAKATKDKGNPFATVISVARIQPLAFNKLGRVVVRCIIGEEEYVAGFLNVIPDAA